MFPHINSLAHTAKPRMVKETWQKVGMLFHLISAADYETYLVKSGDDSI